VHPGVRFGGSVTAGGFVSGSLGERRGRVTVTEDGAIRAEGAATAASAGAGVSGRHLPGPDFDGVTAEAQTGVTTRETGQPRHEKGIHTRAYRKRHRRSGGAPMLSIRRGLTAGLIGIVVVVAAGLAPPLPAEAVAAPAVVFKQGDGGYACVRIPAIVRTKAGTLLAFADGRKGDCGDSADSADSDVILRRSFNGGQNWEPIQVVAAGNGARRHNPTRWWIWTLAGSSDPIALVVGEQQHAFGAASNGTLSHWSWDQAAGV
jgi:hypothetical protein